MDENKLKLLKKIDYKIEGTCGICKFGRFANPAADFGTCDRHTYEHLKHSDSLRALSVFRHGVCGDRGFELDITKFRAMGTYSSFLMHGRK